MSRRTREWRLEAADRWPNLQRLLDECFDEELQDRYASGETALDQAIGRRSLEELQVGTKEWWNWNATRSWKKGGLAILPDGFGVDCDHPERRDAWQFMSAVYDRLIVSVRAEAGKDWRPDTHVEKTDI